MKKELTISAPTAEAALKEGCEKLGLAENDVEYEVIVAAKKGFLGIGSTPATIKIIYEEKAAPAEAACEFAKKLIENMQIDAQIQTAQSENGEFKISIDGEDAGILIGHHGETLDALQYLCNLAANKKDGEDDDREYTRIVVDIAGYRAKREETLRALAKRTAEKVLKYRRSISLEPMPSHERRVIHSEIQKIEGVSTNSIGSEANRRVVIFPEKNK